MGGKTSDYAKSGEGREGKEQNIHSCTEALRALNMAWLFYMSKFLDMFDSFFFVAKKKYGHLSFLHVYHHGIMPLECWFGAK